MLAHAQQGGRAASDPGDPDASSTVDACLARLWPLLLAASEAADGPRPAGAAPPLRAAGAILLATAARLR